MRNIEDIKERLEELEERMEEIETEDETDDGKQYQKAYMYIHKMEEKEGIFGRHEVPKIYVTPKFNIPDIRRYDTDRPTSRVIARLFSLGFDSYQGVKMIGSTEKDIYYRIRVDEDVVHGIEGYWMKSEEITEHERIDREAKAKLYTELLKD